MPRRGPNQGGACVVEVARIWLADVLRVAAETALVTLSAFTCGQVEFGCRQNRENIYLYNMFAIHRIANILEEEEEETLFVNGIVTVGAA